MLNAMYTVLYIVHCTACNLLQYGIAGMCNEFYVTEIR